MAKKVQFTTNQPSASTDYLAADNTWKTIPGGGGGSGTVTSVALTTPAAFNVSGSPITTSGTLAISGAGTASQYVKGDGTLGTTATSLPPNGSAGGDLSGTYPNPTVSKIHGVDMQSGTPATDEVWVYGGSPAKWQHQKLHASQTTNDSTVSGTNVDNALDNLKSSIALKQDTITGAATTITSINLTANRAVISNASGKIAVSTATDTEVGYLSGVTSAIQTQLNGKQDTITGAATTVTTTDLTGSRVLVSNPGGKIAVSAVTTTEVGRLVGVTSDIQTQLNGKQTTVSLTTTGNSGAATFNPSTGALNIPQYAGLGAGTSFIFGIIGNSTIAPSSTQYAALIGYPTTTLGNEYFRLIPTPQNCNYSRFYFYISSTQSATGSLVITLRKNQVDTALAITIAAGSVAGTYSNTTNSVAFSAGDLTSVKIQNNATVTSAFLQTLSTLVTI